MQGQGELRVGRAGPSVPPEMHTLIVYLSDYQDGPGNPFLSTFAVELLSL